MSQRAFLAALVFAVWAGVLSLPAGAQVSTATINGTVRDSGGGLVPDAAIMLRNTGTGVERRTVSNEAGNYVLLNIQPGNYTLEAGKTGFTTSRVVPFTLVVNQTATFDLALSVGSVQQAITVEAIGAEVQSSTAELGAVITRQHVVDLPLNGRNFTQLLMLTPGVSPVSVSQNSSGLQSRPIGTFTFPSVNGQINRANFFMLDGINNQGAYGSTYAIPPIVDAIEEFKVQSHNDQAEFGGVTGGIINVVTKQGTNELHGALWEYLRNNAFDARGFFLPSVTTFRQNMFGVTGGGPVVLPKIYNGRNRTFFFMGYQGFRYRRPAQSYYRVPTPANLTGDLSDELRQIYDPFTTLENPARAGTFIREPFPGNRLPASRLDPGLILYAKSTLPAPIVTGLADRNAMNTFPVQRSQDEYTARVDQNFGEKDFVWFRASGMLQEQNSAGARDSLVSKNEAEAKNIGVSWVRTFGPSSVIQVQMGRTTLYNPTSTSFKDLPASFNKDVGFSPNFVDHYVGGVSLIPNMNVTDFFNGGEGVTNALGSDIWQGKANYSKIVGSHTLKFGGEFNSSGWDQVLITVNSIFVSFDTSDPQNSGRTGSALASYLLNVPDQATRRNIHETMGWGGVIGFYAQDQWRAASRLTVNLGLRYDRTFVPTYGRAEDRNDMMGNTDFNRGVYVLQKTAPPCETAKAAPCIPTPGGVLPANVEVSPNRRIFNYPALNFQPRVGLAYRLGSKTALRASFGMFYDNWAAVIQTARAYGGTWPDVGFIQAFNMNRPLPGKPLPTVRVQDPLPAGVLPAASPFTQVGWFTDPKLKNAYSMQWNAGVQHQLNASTTITANYVGSGTRNLDIGGFYNTALTPGPGNPQSRSLYPYIAPTNYDRSWGRSNYNAFQFLLNRRFSGGLAAMVSYTWAKSIDIGCSGWYVEGCAVQDPYHFNNDRSVSGFDLTHMMTVNWVYRLPFGGAGKFRTGSRVADYIVGNWQVNGIALLRSGQPFGLDITGDIANTGNKAGYMRPNVVGDHRLDKRTPERWFNTAAFAVPPSFAFGSMGRYALRSDWVRNFDLSVFREFPIREGKRAEFRVESFNTFNTPVFGVPTTSMNSPNFGRVLGTANSPRELQMSLRLTY